MNESRASLPTTYPDRTSLSSAPTVHAFSPKNLHFVIASRPERSEGTGVAISIAQKDMIYTHVLNLGPTSVRSPIDML